MHAISLPSSLADRNTYLHSPDLGATSRYRSPVDLSRTTYGERAEQDKRLLTYTSEPLAADVEVAGSPLVTLTLNANTGDGAFR